MLKIFWFVSNLLSPADDVNIHAMLPAAPAAMRFVFKGFQCRSRVQQLRQRLQQGQRGDGALFISSCPRMAYNAMRILALDGASLALRSLPGTGGLLLSPELLSCLALMLVVSALGLDTGSADGIGRNLSTSSSSGVRSSMHPQHPSTREQQQQDSGSSSGGRADGLRDVVQLDRLTPLSCSLFDMLGVSKETALQTAGLARSRGLTTLEVLTVVMSRYSNVLEHQVSYEHQTYLPAPMLRIGALIIMRRVLFCESCWLVCCWDCCVGFVPQHSVLAVEVQACAVQHTAGQCSVKQTTENPSIQALRIACLL